MVSTRLPQSSTTSSFRSFGFSSFSFFFSPSSRDAAFASLAAAGLAEGEAGTASLTSAFIACAVSASELAVSSSMRMPRPSPLCEGAGLSASRVER